MHVAARVAAVLAVSFVPLAQAQTSSPQGSTPRAVPSGRSAAPASASTSAVPHSQSTALVIAGQPDQAPLLHLNGRTYIDVESLARLTHASIRYAGSQIILTLPDGSRSTLAAGSTSSAAAASQFSGSFLAASIEALTAIREWRVSLVNAVQNNTPLSDNWLGPLRRFADAKLQLAVAAATTNPDQQTLELLRNVFANMQQESDSFLAMRARISYIPPDSFDNNAQDQKILACQRALAQVAASRQFQDDPNCH